MSSSQNGWPIVGHDACTDRAVCGAEFPNGWLRGDVDVVFTYLIERLHREVETIVPGTCWGWFVKNIEGTQTKSNHGSATAIDYNATKHPQGVRNTYGQADRDRIHAILGDLDGVVRWGGDYSGTPDDMHFEIHADRAAVERVADRIRAQQQEESDMELTDKYKPSSDACAALDKSPGYEVTVKSGFDHMLICGGRALDKLDETGKRLDALEAVTESTAAKVDEILTLLRTPPTA